MDIKVLTSSLSVSGQISAADLPEISQAGFKSVICNRPDGEGADQPGFSEIQEVAAREGLVMRYLPAESGKVTDEQGAAFGQLMAELPKPILAYCRTGMRSATMWALASAGTLSLPQIIDTSARAGFDMKALVRHWRRPGVSKKTGIQFCNAVVVLSRVADFVPAVMKYVKASCIGLNFGRHLAGMSGPAQRATLSQNRTDGTKERVTQDLDMLHGVPPQKAPDFTRSSPLADAASWLDIDPGTLRHKTYANTFAMDDAANTSNAKTAAAARKQAPVVVQPEMVG